mgnify:CR=1 FL=1
MTAEVLDVTGSWRSVADSANVTIERAAGTKEPTLSWKYRMLLCEHSPIRKHVYDIIMKDLPYWVSVHLVRHKIGVEHWVRTQRSDRTGVSRSELPQGSLIEHEISANAQALITISRKRLCRCASPETREAWEAVRNSIREKDPVMADAMVPECIYRGWCYEFKSCGYFRTYAYQAELERYRRLPGGANVNEE